MSSYTSCIFLPVPGSCDCGREDSELAPVSAGWKNFWIPARLELGSDWRPKDRERLKTSETEKKYEIR
jgi:hypothetical protein